MTDEELFEFLKAEKKTARTAFDELYGRYSSKIYTYCRKVMNNDATAEDLFQETFTRFYESAQNKSGMTNVSGFLIRIARNLCINEKRRKYNSTLRLDDFQIPSYEPSYETKEHRELLEMALELLPDDYREVIVLKEYCDLSYNDIAEIVGVTLPIVRIRIYRAKKKLREILQPYLDTQIREE